MSFGEWEDIDGPTGVGEWEDVEQPEQPEESGLFTRVLDKTLDIVTPKKTFETQRHSYQLILIYNEDT